MASPIHKITAVRKIKMDAGHRIYGHENKCANLHGHEYWFLFYCQAPQLDSVGRIIDFSTIKKVVGNWIDNNLDHGMILCKDDPVAKLYVEATGPLFGQKYFLLSDNPTAENLASLLLKVSRELLSKFEIDVIKVRCQETSNCFAVAEI